MEEQNTQLKNEKDVVSEAEKIVAEKAQSEKQSEIKEEIKTEIKQKEKQETSNNQAENGKENDDIVPLKNTKKKQKITPNSSNPIKEQSHTTSNDNETETKTASEPKHKQEHKKDDKNKETKKVNNGALVTSKKGKKTEKKKGKKGLLIFILLLLIIVGTLSVVFGFITSKSDKIIHGVYVDNVEISDMTKSEALKKLNASYSKNMSDDIILNHGEYTKAISPANLDISINFEDSVDTAFNIGRSEDNIFTNNLKVITTFFNKEKISVITSFNDEKFNELVETLNDEIPDKYVKASYRIEDENLIIENGSSGNKVNSEDLKNQMINSVLSDNKTIEIPVEFVVAGKADVEAIYNEVHKNPKNATFVSDPYKIVREEDGIDFAISMEEAKELARTSDTTFTIPLKITKPEITVKNLPAEAFPDELGTFTTNFSSSSANRANNVRLAAQTIDGTVLMPGEIFSYNDTVGQRTAARGYKEAGVYANGQVTTGIGGGICQVSSTLYNATLLANLEIVARSNHMFNPGYVPAGQDATVSWGGPDFQFKNTRAYPIRISTSSDGGILTVSIHGSKKDDEYDEIKIQSYVTGSIPFSTEYRDDGSLPAGSTKVIQGGSNGCRSVTYKVMYKNGTEISRTVVSNDTYDPHNQIVARGTAAPEPTPNPEPTPSPAPEQPQDSDNTISTDAGDITV